MPWLRLRKQKPFLRDLRSGYSDSPERTRAAALRLMKSIGRIEFMRLVFGAGLAITECSEIREGTTYLGFPCLTFRKNTERSVTITQGENRPLEVEEVVPGVERVLRNEWPKARTPDLWDGRTHLLMFESLRRAVFERATRLKAPQ